MFLRYLHRSLHTDCRCCGNVFCGACASSQYVKSAVGYTTPVRHCIDCFMNTRPPSKLGGKVSDAEVSRHASKQSSDVAALQSPAVGAVGKVVGKVVGSATQFDAQDTRRRDTRLQAANGKPFADLTVQVPATVQCVLAECLDSLTTQAIMILKVCVLLIG